MESGLHFLRMKEVARYSNDKTCIDIEFHVDAEL